MYRQKASEESATKHVCRQLPESLLANFKDRKLSDSSQFISYQQACNWIKQKHLCLRKFINILKLYPSLIQEDAYDPFWNFIQPLLPTSSVRNISSSGSDSNLNLGFSSTAPSVAHINLSHDQSSVETVTESTTLNCTLEACSNTSSSWKKENFLPRNPNLIQQPKSNQSLSCHRKGIVNIPSIFVSTESSQKDLPSKETNPKAYSSKVFLCKDVTDIEDSMSMAVLTSLSSVSFVHCLPPTMQPVKTIIPQCDAFVFIMNNFTVSVSDCLSQLKQAQLLHLPIQFIRYHDFQLPQNLEEIVKISLASDTDLDQYLSIRRRSYVTSPTSSTRGSCCSSDREASPDRSCSPLLYRKQHRNLLPSLPLSGNCNSENNSSKSTAKMISMLVSCLKEGYQKAHLYNSKCHLACVSHIIDSVSKLLESPLSYNTAYFQLKKKKQPDRHSLCSKPTVSNVGFHSSYKPYSNRQTRSKRLQFQKHKESSKTSTSNSKNYPDTNNLILNVVTQQCESKRNHSVRQQQVLFDKASHQISQDSNDYHSPIDRAGIIRLETKPFEDSDHDHEEEDDDEEESSLEFPSLQDGSVDKYLSEEKETSYVVYPDSNLTSDKKPTVIKWPIPLNEEKQIKRQDSLRDETDSNSTNFFDVDLTKELYTSDED